MFRSFHRDEVFAPGGQPTVTYVDRQEFHVERNLARAIAAPNQVVSLAVQPKLGKRFFAALVAGPQSRKKRTKRPLRSGGEADIYEATLLALAQTGPKPSISYEDLRSTLNSLLTDMMPQKHEIERNCLERSGRN
jgi:hypothetical protein